VWKHTDEWRSLCSHLGARCMEIIDAELWAIGLTLKMTIGKGETLPTHAPKTVAGFTDPQATIRRTAHLEPVLGQRLARQLNRRAKAHLTHRIQTKDSLGSGMLGYSRERRSRTPVESSPPFKPGHDNALAVCHGVKCGQTDLPGQVSSQGKVGGRKMLQALQLDTQRVRLGPNDPFR